MKWKKLGLIFAPNGNYEWMMTHAAVPFAEQIKDDVFKIYFSSRDSTNKSYTGYIEVDLKDPRKIQKIGKAAMLSIGAIGTFDENGAMLTWITNHAGKKYIYYIGWNIGVSVPFRNAIGLALSDTLIEKFQKYSLGPILDRTPVDPCFVASCCVLVENKKWRMWYLSCIEWAIVNGSPQHKYHIKYAESDDGIHWERDGIVCIGFKSPDEYAISRPSVIKDGDTYKMWYSYRGEKYRIGYAESADGIKWTRMDEKVGIDVSPSGWDSEMIEYPFVFDHKAKRYMLYNGNGYGKTGFGLAVLES